LTAFDSRNPQRKYARKRLYNENLAIIFFCFEQTEETSKQWEILPVQPAFQLCKVWLLVKQLGKANLV
jgi:hypothetical protein